MTECNKNPLSNLENILAELKVSISIQDADYKIIYQNQILEDTMGKQLGRYCFDAYEQRCEKCLDCPVELAFQDGNIHTAEKIVKTPIGTRFIDIRAIPLKDDTGKVVSVAEIIYDPKNRDEIQETLVENQAFIEKQLLYANALNRMSEVIICNDDTQAILKTMTQVLGETLRLDRAIVYNLNLNTLEADTVCGWLNPGLTDVAPLMKIIDLGLFPQQLFLEKRRWLISHFDEVHPMFKEKLTEFLHGMLGIKSLLWYPFAFTDNSYFLLVLNQVSYRRNWRIEEIEFLEVAAKQVEMAVQKIALLNERKRVEEILHQQAEAINASMDGISIIDPNGIFTYVNKAHARVYGYEDPKELKGMPWQIHYQDDEIERFIVDVFPKVNREGQWRGEAIGKNIQGVTFPQEISLTKLDNGGLICVVHDINERKKVEQQMIYQAHHDPLTGLPNRVLFNDRLNLALVNARRNHEKVAIIFLDLDRFKIVNDTKGHAVGDKLLKSVAKRLKKVLRQSDTISRLGGDEFTILLTKVNDAEDIACVAGKINKVFQEPWVLEGNEFFVTTSIGIAVYPNDGEDVETLMKHADTAMYRAKEKGNNYQFFTKAMNEKIMERLALENNIRQAYKNDEFVVYYQPQVDTITREIIGVEALIRWQHPQDGLIAPGYFIPLAEETGLILPIGEWVLKTACLQLKKWHLEGYPKFKVTVNLSAYQFQQNDLVERVAKILEETQLEPKYLELEITESIAMKDIELSIEVLKRLREMGIQIAIDDFGTGYSSLNYLKQFPIDTLKIDRSFVKDIPNDVDDMAIVSTVIVLAQNLNLKVIAEGVEKEEQLHFLQGKNCNDMQGFYFSKPVPPTELEKLFK